MADNALQKQEQPQGEPRTERVQSACYTPRVDILENDNELILYTDLPGVKPEDVDVQFENGELSVHGRVAEGSEDRHLLVAEYGVGDFYRAFTLQHDIDAEKISAELKQGVLTVHLPKSEVVKPRKIQVQGG